MSKILKLPPTDLRIGNLVLHTSKRGETKQVTINDIGNAWHTHRDLTERYYQLSSKCRVKEYSPLPLTPEILGLLNVPRMEPLNMFGTEDGFLILRCEDDNWDDVAMDVFIQTGDMKQPEYITNVSYAHELQNLYHSLMKQEL